MSRNVNVNKPKENPYKVLYWMGAFVLVLLLGVVALVVLMPKPQPDGSFDPERTLLWMYDANNPSAPASLAVIEESRSNGSLVAVPFPAPAEAMAAFKPGRGKAAQEEVARFLDRQIHHRVFLPYGVVATLIDAAGGITVEGESMGGGRAIAFIHAGGEQSSRRAMIVMLELAEAATTRGISMGITDGLRLFRQVDTDMDMMEIPDALGRWSGYAEPRVESPANFDPATLRGLLRPDPPPSAEK